MGYAWVDDVYVNHELLKIGFVWHYKYFNKDPGLAAMEEKAREAKSGHCSDPNPVAPQDLRVQ